MADDSVAKRRIPLWLALAGLAIVTIAVLLRFRRMDYLGPWIDEGTYLLAGRNAFEPALDFAWINGWKFAYPPLAHLAEVCTGSWLGARYLNAVIGLGTIAIAYAWARSVIFDLAATDKRTTHELGGLASLALLSCALPLVFTSRLATYDAPAFLWFALALYLGRRARRPGARTGLLVAASAVSLFLGFLSKYVVILYVPLFVADGFLLAKDRRRWMVFALVPLAALALVFAAVWGRDFVIGASSTATGPWVDRDALGVTKEWASLVGAPLLLACVGFAAVPRAHRREALLLLGGSSILYAYYLWAGHVQALIKLASFSLILLAPLFGLGFAKLVTLRRPLVRVLGIAVLVPIGIYSTLWIQPAWKMGWWEDRGWVVTAETEVLRVARQQGRQPKIWSMRPFEDIALNPDLQDVINRDLDPDNAIAASRFALDLDTVLGMVERGELDLCVVVDGDLTRELRARVDGVLIGNPHYVYFGADTRAGATPFGVVRRPSGSRLYVKSDLYEQLRSP